MQIGPSLHSDADNYKLLTNLVVPRLHINNFATHRPTRRAFCLLSHYRSV